MPNPEPPGRPVIAAELFDLLWETLADILGTAATAALVRRATKRSVSAALELPTVIVNRNTLTYEYRVPETWRQPGDAAASRALRALARELGTLLVELTGPVVLRRLERVTPFRESGISFAEEPRRP